MKSERRSSFCAAVRAPWSWISDNVECVIYGLCHFARIIARWSDKGSLQPTTGILRTQIREYWVSACARFVQWHLHGEILCGLVHWLIYLTLLHQLSRKNVEGISINLTMFIPDLELCNIEFCDDLWFTVMTWRHLVLAFFKHVITFKWRDWGETQNTRWEKAPFR